jgi:hypothetical protein
MILDEFARIMHEVISSDVFRAAVICGVIGFLLGRFSD